MPPTNRILLNPAAGGGRGGRLAGALHDYAGLEVRCPDGPAALADEARRAADEGLERLIVAGGDGTLHHAIRGLAGTPTALAIVPTGTGNDLARALDLPLEPRAALEHAIAGRIRSIDLGRVNGVPFAGIAAVGFDGDVLDYMRRRRRLRLPGGLDYAWAVTRTLLGYRARTLTIDAETWTLERPALLAVVANSPLFGGGMRIAPDAALDDGWLDAVMIGPVSRLETLLLFPSVYRGTHVDRPFVSYRRVRRARLGADRAATVHGDGEPLHDTANGPAEVEIWPDALRVVGGAGSVGGLLESPVRVPAAVPNPR